MTFQGGTDPLLWALTVNKELTGLQLVKKRLGGRARLGGQWEEGQSLRRHQEMLKKQHGTFIHEVNEAQ